MTITGVTNIECGTIRKIKVSLVPSHTGGHNFCELIVDETTNRFTAILYGGESYTYCWDAPGDNFIQFLIDIFAHKDHYLYYKLADHSKEKYIDTEKTGNHLKNVLLKARRRHEIDASATEDMWENIEQLQAEDDMTQSNLYGVWNQWFDQMIEHDIISDEPWHEDFIQYEKDWACLTFCEKVTPILAEVLKQEYAS